MDKLKPKTGSHYWAFSDDSLIVVRYDGFNLFSSVGTDWTIGSDELILLEEIPEYESHDQ